MECTEKHSMQKLIKTKATLATLGDIIVLLCGFNATISFIEACFWHLTEPSALGFRFLPVIYLFACLVAPSLFSLNEYFKHNLKLNISWAFVEHLSGICLVTPSVLSIRNYLNNFKVHHKLKFQFFWIVIEPLLLFISSLSCLDEAASYRTAVLGVATFLLPSVLRYRSSILNQIAVKVSVVLYITTCVRWTSHSVNIFYEEWHLAAVFLIMTLLIFLSEVLVNKMISENSENDSILKLNSSFEEEELVNVKIITPQTNLSMKTHKETVSVSLKDTSDPKTISLNNRTEGTLSVSSGYNSVEQTSSLYENSQFDNTTIKDLKVSNMSSFIAIILTPGIASYLIFFCQFLSSPQQFLRWSGFERSSSNEIFVVAYFTLTTLFVLFSDCTSGKHQVVKTDEENQSKTYLNVSLLLVNEKYKM